MKSNDFNYTGTPPPKIKTPEHENFIMHFQKSMLLSLVKRNLLTQFQMDCVMAELENQRGTVKK